MLNPLFHALNVATLAGWLSVAGAGGVAILVKLPERLPMLKEFVRVELTDGVEMSLSEPAAGSAPLAEEETASQEPTESLEPVTPETPELPELPELPDLAETPPLPEVPDFPLEKAEPAPQPSAQPKPAARPQQAQPRATPRPKSQGGSPNGGGGTGTGSGSAAGNGSGAVGAARWAGGRMSPPNYPIEARRANQEGRVVVLFSVDEQGNVVSAKVTQACPYAALNEEALRAVRRWKFKPGPRASLQRPIIFKLR